MPASRRQRVGLDGSFTASSSPSPNHVASSVDSGTRWPHATCARRTNGFWELTTAASGAAGELRRVRDVPLVGLVVARTSTAAARRSVRPAPGLLPH
jgi:hypothetical protein